MKLINHRIGRYLLLLPILIAALAIMYFANLTAEINTTLLEEKFLEKQLDLDLVDNLVDQLIARDNDWATYDYQSLLGDSIEFLDKQPFTFSALYTEDLQYVSYRTPSYEELFDPFIDRGFKQAVLTHAQGSYVVKYTPADQPERDMHIYYRWVPTDTSLDQRFLSVVAISEFSISSHTADWVGWGALMLIATVTVLNIALVALLSRLGHIYDLRRGDKWRGVDFV